MKELTFLTTNDDSELFEILETASRYAQKHLSGVKEFRRADFDGMATLGFTGIGIDEHYGGSELSSLGLSALLFEISKTNLGPAIYLSVHLMVARIVSRFGNQQHHGPQLEAMAKGKALAAFCLTEAQAGSDAAALKLSAKKQGDEYILDGEKIYISSAPHADLLLVFARTGADDKSGISCFLIDAKTPGIEVGPEEKKMGCEASPIASVRFTNCHISQACRVGEEGDGFKIALSGLNRGRVSIAACACGLAATALSKAREHLLQRTQFGSPLAEFQGLQFILADMVMQFRAATLLTREACQRIDSGDTSNAPASMAKCFATDAAMTISTDAVQLLGGAGYLADYGVEQLMRDAKMLQIVEGTNQIQRILVARQFLKNN